MSQFATGFESAKSAVRALRHNMLRSFLTLLGIVIGVASVITMLAIGDGAKKQVVEAISSIGSNLLNVRPGTAANNRGSDREQAACSSQTSRPSTRNPERHWCRAFAGKSLHLPLQGQRHPGAGHGNFLQVSSVKNWPIALGTFFEPEDEKSYAPVAVLGRTVADALFPDGEIRSASTS